MNLDLRQTLFAFCLAALSASLAPLRVLPDVLLLHDGKRIEGDVADKGNAYELKTRFGILTVNKSDVQKIVKDPAQLTAEAETLRTLARGMYDDALKIEGAPRERNRKLTAGVELLGKALAIYNEAREIFTGPAYGFLDKPAAAIIQEMRLYRDKMVTEVEVKPPEPSKSAPSAATPAPAPAAPPADQSSGSPAGAAAAKPTDGAMPDAVASLEPVKPPSARCAAAGRVRPVAPAPRPMRNLLADLASTDAAVRRVAAEELGRGEPAEALSPLVEAFQRESDASTRGVLVSALGAYDGSQLAKQPALLETARKGTDAQRRALVALFREVGTEAGTRFLVEGFVATRDVALRNEVASALRKHKGVAVRPLVDCFRRHGTRADIQTDVVRILGILRETRQGSPFLVALLEWESSRGIATNALQRIGRPAVPALIQGLGGTNHIRLYAAVLLRGLTGQPLTSQKTDEWSQWWASNRKTVELEEAKRESEDAAAEWPVTNDDWKG
jgi:hypothetical protein